MKRKSSILQPHFRSGDRLHGDRLASFREQMADFARGAEMKRLRKDLHLSQATAAYKIGVTERTVRAWEKGGAIQWPNAKRAGAFYGVEPESLVSRELANMEGVSAEQINRIEQMLKQLLDHFAIQEMEEIADDESQEPDQGSERKGERSG